MARRVVVTGVGAVTPLGLDMASSWKSAIEGRSGIGPVSHVDASDLAVRIAGEVRGFDPGAHLGVREARKLDRFAQFAVVAAREAVADAGLDVAADPDRVGVLVSTACAGVASYEAETLALDERGPGRVSPHLTPSFIPNSATAEVTRDLGAQGPSLAPVAACAGGTSAIGLGLDLIRAGRVDKVIAGGADAGITRVMLAALAAARAVSLRNDEPERAYRPFDTDRDGFVMAEGSAALVLEDLDAARARGAEPIAEVAGFGAASDAFHATAPRPDGAGHVAAIRSALTDAGATPDDVGYVNAHGTATVAGDRVEAAAVRRLLGDRVPTSSTKSMSGHLYGGAGVLEAAFCVLALRDGVLPPTINCEHPDPECGIDPVPGEARAEPIRLAMSNSFGFGGHDASVVLRRL